MNLKKPMWDSGTLEPVYRSHSGERAMPSWIFPRPECSAASCLHSVPHTVHTDHGLPIRLSRVCMFMDIDMYSSV